MHRTLSATLLLTTSIVFSAAGLRAAEQPVGADADDHRQAVRLECMAKRVSQLEAVDAAGEADAFAAEPALRYDDPQRGVVDASAWVLGGEGRPPAVLVLEVYNNDTVMYELTAIGKPPQRVEGPGWRWTPADAGFDWLDLPVDTPPAPTAAMRQSQLKRFAGDFASSEYFNGATHELRTIPCPLHTYEDVERGVLSGAVFVIANGRNAEILLTLEARAATEDCPERWVAGFSRLASASLEVAFAGEAFWANPQQIDEQPNKTPKPLRAYVAERGWLNGEEAEAFRASR